MSAPRAQTGAQNGRQAAWIWTQKREFIQSLLDLRIADGIKHLVNKKRGCADLP